MFHKILKTKYPPKYKPVLIWDGHCGFCKFWITRWKAKTGDALEFKTFQETSQQYKDFPLTEMYLAVLILHIAVMTMQSGRVTRITGGTLLIRYLDH